MVCKKCSANLPDDALFCLKCGSRVDGNKTCHKCEKLIPEESVFCVYCGAKVGESIPVTPTIEQKQENEIVAPVIIPVAVSTETTSDNVTEIDNNSNLEVETSVESDETPIIQGIVCTQCGSGNVELITESLGRCNNCGTQIIINANEENNVITNNVNITMVANGNFETPISFYELPKEIDEKTFYANALTQIALDKNSPVDVFISSKFEPVKTEYRQYLFGKGTAEMTYTATVGYDRKEQYTTTTNKHLSEGDYYTYKGVSKRADRSGTFTVDTIKERTVTDWQPFNGSHTGEYNYVSANEDLEDCVNTYDYKNLCIQSAIEYDASSSTSPAPLAPTSSAIEALKSGIKSNASYDCEKSLPGDRKKDFKSNGHVTLSLIESHVAPQYILKYNYLNVEYTSKAHSCKNSVISGDIPSAQTEIETEIEENKTVKTLNIITLCTLLFSILSSILFPIVLKIIFAVVGIASFITYWIIRSKTSKEIYAQKTLIKKQTLIEHLKKKGIKIPKELKGV